MARIVWEMSRRRSVVVFLLVAAMSALALAVGLGRTGAGGVQAAGTGGEGGAFNRDIRPGLESAVVRVRLDEPRGPAEQRSSKTGLALLAVLGLLAVVPMVGYRRTVGGRSAVTVPVVWWSPISGRAPPSLQLAVY